MMSQRLRSTACCLLVLLLVGAGAAGQVPAAGDEQEPDQQPQVTNQTETSDEGFELDPCAPMEAAGESWIDWLHTKVYTSVCGSALWFDNFFGNERIEVESDETHGRLSLHVVWSEYDDFDFRGRFRAHINLPNVDNRFHAFFGRLDKEEYLTDTVDTIEDPYSAFRETEGNDWMVGLGYNPLRGRSNHKLRISAGVKVSFPMDPYVKTQYRFHHLFGDNRLVRFRQTLFWRNEERLGTTTNIDLDQRINHRFLLRWANTATLTQESDGVRWWSNLALYHDLSSGRAMAYKIWWRGETEAPVTVRETGFRIIYRQQIWREWLFGDVETGVSWPQEYPHQKREASFCIGVGFEMKWGRWQ
jgi:hypothetical protein